MQKKDQNNNRPKTTQKGLDGVLGLSWFIDSVRNRELVSGCQRYDAKITCRKFRHKGNILKYESSMSVRTVM